MSSSCAKRSARSVRNVYLAKARRQAPIQRLMSSEATPSRSRAELHAMAASMHKKKLKDIDDKLMKTKDTPFIKIPDDMRFHFRDTREIRLYKQRQQYQYMLLEKFGFVLEKQVKLGMLNKDVYDNLMQTANKRLADLPTVPRAKQSILASKAQEISQKYAAYIKDAGIELNSGDSKEEKVEKTKKMFKMMIGTANETVASSLESIGVRENSSVKKEVNEVKWAKEFRSTTAKDALDVETLLEKYKDDIEKAATEFGDADIDIHETLSSLMKRITDSAMELDPEDIFGKETVALREAGLLPTNGNSELELELRIAQENCKRREDEYNLRYGKLEMPTKEEDPYQIEYEKQKVFLVQQLQTRKMENAKAIEAASVEEGKGEGEGEANEISTTPAEDSEEEEEDIMKDFNAYAAQNETHQFLDSEIDHPKWPRVVDGLKLDKYEHMKNFNWAEFELAPEPFEVRVLDAFEKQRQLQKAKKENITLVPRVEIASGPDDPSLVRRVLHLYRINALRSYIKDIRRRRAIDKEREYRDLDDLRLEIKFDPETPWLYDFWNETKLVLNNQCVWTTGQKERYLKTLHHVLTSKNFSEDEAYRLGMHMQDPTSEIIQQRLEERSAALKKRKEARGELL